MKRSSKMGWAILSGLVISLIVAEMFIRLLHIDLEMLKYSLYYMPSQPTLMQVAVSPRHLHFKPKPGTHDEYIYRHDIDLAKHDSNKQDFISFNSFGFRSPEWPREKSPGVKRIFFFGGSNTYGLSVEDGQAYPDQLQKLLDKKFPGKFQLWNGGMAGAVLAQKAAYARYIADKLSPDLIIIQDYVNHGRKPFLSRGNEVPSLEHSKAPELFAENPELYLENIPLLISNNESWARSHDFLVKHFAVYRLVNVIINNSLLELRFPFHHTGDCIGAKEKCDRLSTKFEDKARAINRREFMNLVRDLPEPKILLMDPIKRMFCNGEPSEYDGVPSFSICFEGKSDEYYDIHPPAYVYSEYANEIFNYLEKNGLLD